MNDLAVLRVVAKFCTPFILLFGLYVQFHGKYSPGGGFQAGVIIAAAIILYAIVFGPSNALKVFPLWLMRALAALGVIIYAGTGFVALLMGGEYLNYSVLLQDPLKGQYYGILAVEIGVGLTVACVMLLLYFAFALYRQQDEPSDEGEA